MKKVQYQDLKVSVSFGAGNCVKSQSFSLDAAKLPQSLSVEGLLVTVESTEKKQETAGPRPINPDRIASRGAKNRKSVELTLPDALTADQPTWKKYCILPVPREVRTFFPQYKKDFVIRTPRGEFLVAIASAHEKETDPYRGGYISRGVTKLYAAHSDLQPGDVLVFKKDGKADVDGKSYPCYTMRVK